MSGYAASLRRQLATSARVSASEAKNQFGKLLDAALSGDTVVITKHDEPKAVLISIKEYEAMVLKADATTPRTRDAAQAAPPPAKKRRRTMGMFRDFEDMSFDDFKAARAEISKTMLESVKRVPRR